MRRSINPVLMGLIMSNAACQRLLDVDSGDLPLVQTDRLEYVAETSGDRLRFDIVFDFTNSTRATLSIRQECWSPAIELFDGEDWLPLQAGGVCLDVFQPDIVLMPGEVFSGTVSAGLDRDLRSPTLRLVFEVTAASRDIPEWLRISNVFTVRP